MQQLSISITMKKQ